MRRSEPERTCIGCRQTAPKGALARVVRAPSGEVRIDASGRAPGRGAYVHRRAACMRAATRGGALARALRATLGPERAARLMDELAESAGATD